MNALLVLLVLYLLLSPIILLVLVLQAMGRGREAMERIDQLQKSINELRFKVNSMGRRLPASALAEADAADAARENARPPEPTGLEATEDHHGDDPAAVHPPLAPVSVRTAMESAKQPNPFSPTEVSELLQREPADQQKPLPPPTPETVREGIPWGRLLDAFGLQPPRPGEAGEAVTAAWWVTRIGMVLGIIAAVFFGIYVSQSSGPWLRLAQLLTVSVAVTGVGLWQERTLARFGQVLTGGGLALLFFCCYGAAALPALRVIESPALGSLVQALGVAGILGFALWRRSEPVGTMAIGFGYVACWFAQAHGLQPWTLGGLWALAATACLLQWRFQWHTARAVALAGSYAGLALLALLVWPHNPPGSATLLIWLLALAAVFGLSCQRSLSLSAGPMPPFAGGWCLANSSAASALGLYAFLQFHPTQANWFFLSFALLWLGLAWLVRVTLGPTESQSGATAAVFPALILKASTLLCLWIIDTFGGSLQAPAVALQGFGLLWLLRRERSLWLPAALGILLTVVMPGLALLEWRTVALPAYSGNATPLPPWPQAAHLGGIAAALLALTLLTLTQRWNLLDHVPELHRQRGLWWARLVFGLLLSACLLLPWQGSGQGFALLVVVVVLGLIGLKAGAGRQLDPLPSAAIAWAPVYLIVFTGMLGDLHHLPSLALAASALLVLVATRHAMPRWLGTSGHDAADPATDGLTTQQGAGLALTALALITVWQPLHWTIQGPPGAPDLRLLWWLGAMALTILILARQLPKPETEDDSPFAFTTGPVNVARLTRLLCLAPWLVALLMALKAFSPPHLPWIMVLAGSMALLAVIVGTVRARPLWWTTMALWLSGFVLQWRAFAAAPEEAGSILLLLNPLLLVAATLAGVMTAARHLPAPAVAEPGMPLPVPHPLRIAQALLHLGVMMILIQLFRWYFAPGWNLLAATTLALLWLLLGRAGGSRRWFATETAALPVLLMAAFQAVSWLTGRNVPAMGPQVTGPTPALELLAGVAGSLLLVLLLPAVRAHLQALWRPGGPEARAEQTAQAWFSGGAVALGWWFAATTLFHPDWQVLGLAIAALAAAASHRFLKADGMPIFSMLLSGAAIVEAVRFLLLAFPDGVNSSDPRWLSLLLAATTLAITGAVMLGKLGRKRISQSASSAIDPVVEFGESRAVYAWAHGLAALVLAFAAWSVAPAPFDNVVTICWGGSAVAMWLLGLGVRLRAYRMTGLLGFAVCIVRMFAVDIHQTIERIIAFAVVAVVLLLTGYLYSRLRNWVDPPDAADPSDMSDPSDSPK